jgi:DNA-binding LacI/PurR family transcriptional regulator
MNGGRVTAEMVAQRAKVSRVAVSRAFNPHTSLKPEKRELILRIAQELNYTPDRAARALVSGRSHLVGVIVPDVCSHWESQEIDALTTALQDEGFATLLFKTRTDYSMDEKLLAYMRGFNPDSVIAFVENVKPTTLVRFLDRAVPIYVHYPQPGADEEEGGPLYDRLNVLQRNGVEQAVALLRG